MFYQCLHQRQMTNGFMRCQGLGHTVAYCGDGINDIAALHAADLGIAIGATEAVVAAPVFTPVESVSGWSHGQTPSCILPSSPSFTPVESVSGWSHRQTPPRIPSRLPPHMTCDHRTAKTPVVFSPPDAWTTSHLQCFMYCTAVLSEFLLVKTWSPSFYKFMQCCSRILVPGPHRDQCCSAPFVTSPHLLDERMHE